MKFNCHRDLLIREISAAQKVISQKNSISIISNVLLSAQDNQLTIKATDTNQYIESRIPITTEENGQIAIYCDTLANVLKVLPTGTIFFSEADGQLTITSEENKSLNISLKTTAADLFPSQPPCEEELFFNISQSQLLKMREQTIFSVANDDTRIYVNGVYFTKKDDRLVMVATDAKRLSYCELDQQGEIPAFEGVIIPPKFLNILNDLGSREGNLALAFADKKLFSKFDEIEMHSTLFDGPFPNYEKIIATPFDHKFTFSVNNFMTILRRASIMSDSKSLNKIFLIFYADKVVFKAVDSKVGEFVEELEGEYSQLTKKRLDLDATPLTLALNHTFLSDPLKAMQTASFELHFVGENKPIALHPVVATTEKETDEPVLKYYHIIMPMQVD